jgi:hypothetical protein
MHYRDVPQPLLVSEMLAGATKNHQVNVPERTIAPPLTADPTMPLPRARPCLIYHYKCTKIKIALKI